MSLSNTNYWRFFYSLDRCPGSDIDVANKRSLLVFPCMYSDVNLVRRLLGLRVWNGFSNVRSEKNYIIRFLLFFSPLNLKTPSQTRKPSRSPTELTSSNSPCFIHVRRMTEAG